MAVFRGAIGIVCAAFACLDTAPLYAETPLVQIGTRQYTAQDLTGCTWKQLQEEFQTELKTMSDEDVRNFLQFNGFFLAAPDRDPAKVTRLELDKGAWEIARDGFLSSVAQDLILASITENIIKSQRVQIEDYFDLNALHDRFKREGKYSEFWQTHRTDDKTSDAELSRVVNDQFRGRATVQNIRERRAIWRVTPKFRMWSLQAKLHSLQGPDTATRAVLSQFLLRSACERGVYAKRAEAYYEFTHSSLQVFDIRGYKGDPLVLGKALSSIVDLEGNVAVRGWGDMQRSIGATDRGVSLWRAGVTGDMLIEGMIPLPVGQMIQMGPESFRILGWSQRVPIPRRAEADSGVRDTWVISYSYAIAADAYAAHIASLVPEWKPDRRALLRAIIVQEAYVNSGVEVDLFVKKEYPAEPFNAWEMERPRLQEIAFKMATSTGPDGADERAKLLAIVRDRVDKAKSEVVKDAYRSILEINPHPLHPAAPPP